MDLNKMFGIDGLLVEFYKIFWKDIFILLVLVFNYVFEFGCFFII